MERDSIILLIILASMMALFVHGRPRYDLVALAGLLAGWAAGVVPVKQVFVGFGDDIVIIIAGALIVSQAVYNSGIVERLVHKIEHRLVSPTSQVATLTATTMLLSTVIKNIGALSMLMPVAGELARRHGTFASRLFMPMSFAALLGGLATLVGTSPNVIVSRLREELVGQPFRFFDFAFVGLPVALAGLVYLIVAYRLLPATRPNRASDLAALESIGYTTEALVASESPFAGKPVSDLHQAGKGEIEIVALLRGDNKRITGPSTQLLKPEDRLILHGPPRALQNLVSSAGLRLARSDTHRPTQDGDSEIATVEAIVAPNSVMLEWSPSQLRVFDRFRVNFVAINRGRQRIAQRLKQVRFQPGDVILIQGNQQDISNAIQQLGLLPLAVRNVPIGRRTAAYVPVAILAVSMGLMASGLVPVAIAFLAAAVAMVALRCISLREAYGALDPALLVTFAALVPLSQAIETTGTAGVLAGWLAFVSQPLPTSGAIACILIVAMLVTPFLNNAATVLVLAPVVVELARRLEIAPDAALMAVAIGAASDFLTPIGHQCNMLAMGPGGYRFSDYPRLGLPLSFLVVAIATPLVVIFWT